jgi:hypothetical protein
MSLPETPVIIVSGLPRSGTSLMMQMLDRGGIEIVTDQIRTADVDNPHGYCEFEKVKQVKQDASWLPGIRGKAVKMVSQLLYDLPATERYQIIFMERDLDETLASQEKMLERLGRKAAPRDQIRKSFQLHLDRVHCWLKQQSHITVLPVRYDLLLEKPRDQAELVRAFLRDRPDVEQMVQAVDPSLYRNRKPAVAPPT